MSAATTQPIALADARRIIAAAQKKAEEIGQPMNVAVVDEGGNLLAFERMTNAWLGSIDISIKKAWTSRAFDITTQDLAKHSQSGDQFFGIHVSNDCKVMIFAGGIPLKGATKLSVLLASAVVAENRIIVSLKRVPKLFSRNEWLVIKRRGPSCRGPIL